MLEIRARVISVQSDKALVEALQNSSCGHCSTPGGCGSNSLSKLFCSNKSRSFLVANPISAQPGEEVVIAMVDGALLRGATLVYLVPLAGLISGAWVGTEYSFLSLSPAGDISAALFALFGLCTGFMLVHGAMRAGLISNTAPYISSR